MIGKALKAIKGSETAKVTGNSAVVVAVRVIGTGATFLYTMLMARQMSPTDFGLVWAVWSGTYIAGNLATLNIGSGAVREVIKARAEGREDIAAGFVIASRLTLLFAAPLVVAGFIALSWFRSPDLVREHWIAFLFMAMAIPVMGWMQTNGSQAAALSLTIKSQAPRSLIRPLLFLSTFSVLALINYRPGPDFVTGLYCSSVFLAAIVQFLLLRRHFGFVKLAGKPDVSHWGDWIKSGLVLAPSLLLGEYLKNIIVLVAAATVSTADVGMVAIALSLVNFLNFGITAVDISFSPKIAGALTRNHPQRVRHFLMTSSFLTFVPVATASVLLLLLADYILPLFGSHYADGAMVSAWFLLIPFSRAVFGGPNLIMQVRGHRKEILITTTLGLIVLAASIYFGGEAYGIMGVAAACGLTMAGLQAVRWLTCLLTTGFDTSIFGAIRYAIARPKTKALKDNDGHGDDDKTQG